MERNETLAGKEGQGLETGKEAPLLSLPILSPIPHPPDRLRTKNEQMDGSLPNCPSVKLAALFSPQAQTRDNHVMALRSMTAEIMQMPSPLPNQL